MLLQNMPNGLLLAWPLVVPNLGASIVTLQIIWRRTLHAFLAYFPSMDRLARLTEEARKLALDRFRRLQPHLEEDYPLKAVSDKASASGQWSAEVRPLGAGLGDGASPQKHKSS